MNIRLRKNYYIPSFYVFIAGIFLLKLILMGIFSSDYQNILFMRFVNEFLGQLKDGNLINPYEYFIEEAALFPYPPVMLGLECIGGGLSMLAGKNLILMGVLFKVPNLFFDCLGMYYLMKMFPGKRKYIAVIYFASPVIIYSTYMHGQLDIIPTTLLLGAIGYLTSPQYRDDRKYILLLATAIACKFHILAVLPILFLFIAKRDGWKRAFINTVIPILIVVICIIPFWGNGFLYNVLLNNEQSVLTKVTIDFVNIKIYVPILAIILIYLKVITIGKVNKELLYSCCGILFSVFLVLIPPMPGWYVWIIPFVTIFFIDVRSERYLNLVIYALLNFAYILYFLFAHQSSYVDLYFFTESLEWLKITNPIIINSMFTVLTSILLYIIYMMFQSGIVSNSLYKRRNMPFIIGISGDSGSGKSTFISMVEMIFGKKQILYIEGDGDHKWERGNAMWKHFTHLNPKSNHLYRQAGDLATLKAGQSIMRVDYDHDSGQFTKQYKLRPKPYILLCGLHSLYLPQVRKNLDLKIYMDIDENLRRYWKIQRDIKSRGYTKDQILNQILDRVPDSEKYIHPQKKYADLLVCYFDKNLTDSMLEDYTIHLSLKVTLNIEINLEHLIEQVENYGIIVRYDYDEDLKNQTIVFEGESLESQSLPIDLIARNVVPHLDEIINCPLNAVDDLHGILEIVVLLLISRKLRGDDI